MDKINLKVKLSKLEKELSELEKEYKNHQDKLKSHQTKLKSIEWAGTTLAITAASMLALKIDISGYAFWLYICSNVLWIMAARTRENRALLVMTLAFLFVNAIGVYNWLL